MASPTTKTELVDLLQKCRLFEPAELDPYLAGLGDESDSAQALVERMLADGKLSKFQAGQLMKGKYRGFVLGRYKLLDRIGMGGMGQVFLAEHSSMGRRVAIKVLPPDRAKNEFAKKRFLREARATGQLDHPNIVKAFDVDTDGDVNFLVLEYVEGASFQELVTRGGPLTAERTAHYLCQALAGLQYLHERGFIHRDIKPANIVVDRAGVVKLLDLGLVRSELEGDELTRKEDVKFLGTADYLAPEQAIDCKTVDGRADIYGLGATGYFLLTGAPPFGGESVAAKLIAHQKGDIRPVHQVMPSVPAVMSAVIQKMMAKRPEDRFATPAEVIPAFAAWVKGPTPPPQAEELPNGRPNGLSNRAATVNTFPSAQIRSSAAGGGNSSQTTGSEIRFHTDSSGAGSGIPKPTSSATATTPAPLVFTPKPGTRPPVLPAAASHSVDPIPTANPKMRLPGIPLKSSGVVVLKNSRSVANPTVTRRRSIRQWLAIASGFLLTVVLTAWNTVMVKAASPRDPSTVHAHEPTARR